MDQFLTLAVSGAVTGAIYSLIAAGVTLSYATTGIFNFAYGAIAYTCAVSYFQLNTALGWPSALSALLVIGVIGPLIGIVLDWAVFRRLGTASSAAKVVAPVGLMIALPPATRLLIDRLIDWFSLDSLVRSTQLNAVGFPSGVGPVPRRQWTLPGGANLDSNQLALAIAALGAALALWVILRHLHIGLRMRAVVDSNSLARLRGIDTKRTSRTAWMLGCTLAATAGVLGAPILGSLNESSFIQVQFVASAAAVLGGFRSVPLAALGGVLLGITQNLVFQYATFASSISGFNTSVPFVLLLGGLVVMARDRRRVGGIVADGAESASGSVPFPRWFTVTVCGLFLGWLFFLADPYWMGVAITGLALAIVLLSFVVVTGLGGMVSLAQATFVSIAGLVTGMLVNRYGLPFVPAAIVGIAVAVVLGAVVALPALRLGGLPLALATLALAFVGERILFRWDWLRNEQTGWYFGWPELGPFSLADRQTFAIVLLVLVAACVFVIRNLERSTSGRSVMAVRGSALAAATSGIEPARVKLFVFATSAGIAGLGGVMLAINNRSATDASYPAVVGLLWLTQVVLFGVRRPGTAIAAGITAAIFPEVLRSGFHWPGFVPTWLDWDGSRSAEIPAILFGLGAVAVAQSPNGFLHVYAIALQSRRRHRSRVDDTVVDERSPQAMSVPAGDAHADDVDHVLPGTDEAALAIRRLDAGYDDIRVLHGVDLALHSGEVTLLLGPNGSGKTTLCRAVSGLIPTTNGVMETSDSDDLAALPVHRRSTDAGVILVPQDRGVFPGLTVDENLRVWLRDDQDRQQAYDRFPVLAARARVEAGSLSGGEQQMLSLASMVVRAPKVLVVDEPTLGLAPMIAGEVLRVIRELADMGVAVLIAEEKPGAVLPLADRVGLLSLGRVVWSGERDALRPEQVEEAYLGTL